LTTESRDEPFRYPQLTIFGSLVRRRICLLETFQVRGTSLLERRRQLFENSYSSSSCRTTTRVRE